MPLNDWMSAYQDRKLGELILPGSHDAGTINDHVEFTGKGTQANAVTQNLTIAEQLNIGTRFFDLRLKERGDLIVPHHTTTLLGKAHGAFGTDSLGTLIDQARTFCEQNGQEVVIFRISHTKTSTHADRIVRQHGGDQLSRCTGNLCNRTLQEIRTIGRGFGHDGQIRRSGGLVCLFNEGGKKPKIGKTDHSANFGVGGADVIDQSEGIHSFKKYKEAANDRGIATCGCYTGTNALSKVIRNALSGQFEHVEKHNPFAPVKTHLWQVYWQKTYLNPFHSRGIETGTRGLDPDRQLRADALKYRTGPGGTPKDVRLHGGTHAATEHLLHLMQGHVEHQVYDEDYVLKKRKFKKNIMMSTQDIRATLLPNILSYDFVNSDINNMIVQLNAPNGIFHQDDE